MKPVLTPLAQLVRDLDAAAVSVRVKGDRISVSSDHPLPFELERRIRASRAELLELLSVFGQSLLPLFRDPTSGLSVDERRLLIQTEAEIRARRLSMLGQADRAVEA